MKPQAPAPPPFASTAASAEHQQLAHTIKRTHRRLRDDTQRLGAQRAWQAHLADTAQLSAYSAAMRRLATDFWAPNTERKAGRRTRSSASTEHNRIAWSVRQCAEYFGTPPSATTTAVDDVEKATATPDPPTTMLLHQRERERRIWAEAMTEDERTAAAVADGTVDETAPELWHWPRTPPPHRLRLLDVGSCYNPFAQFADRFDVTAVDIAPAGGTGVQQCDFLALRIESSTDDAGDEASQASTNDSPPPPPATSISSLPAGSFDAVVFSLLLEYMPTSEQRLQCCRNAYRLLRPEGILLIITPDSKHVGANARLMKTWRYALALVGLSRVRLEKLEHLTCMVFRRSVRAAVARRWALVHREAYMEEAMRIPQDDKPVVDERRGELEKEDGEAQTTE